MVYKKFLKIKIFYKLLFVFFTFPMAAVFSLTDPECLPIPGLTIPKVSQIQKVSEHLSDQSNSFGLSKVQILRMQQLTSYFENSKINFQYDYIENLDDGRGFTAGRVGFCSGTGDLILVVESYCEEKSLEQICSFLPRLREINLRFIQTRNPNPDVSGIENFEIVWRKTSADPYFRKIQDDFVNRLYLVPALQKAETLGLNTPIGKAIFFDTFIQHGDESHGESAEDSISALIKRTNDKMKFTPQNEVEWIKVFLETRRTTLLDPHNKNTKEEWKESVSRVDKFYELISSSENINLTIPIKMARNLLTD